jgi:DNA helicase II / ATP-dependent DNA helicase PcrA
MDLPEITDEDIHWAETSIGLDEGCFDDDRKNVLKALTSVDIQACPGSGKTTLLVAKLAILGKKWKEATSGFCVLSHTNVAREEIQNRLGKTEVGQALLSYPHFIGTIHSFVSEYIALPWIRSLGYPVKIVDREITLKRRWCQIPVRLRQSCLKNYTEEILDSKEIGKPQSIRIGKGYLKEDSDTYKTLKESIEESYRSGYFTYNELFLFALDALGHYPAMIENLQHRFPFVFIDEAQDCSEIQNQLISHIFPANEPTLIRQRFGDGNQAIFDFPGGDKVLTDSFPQDGAISISNSLRLSPAIANFADPLGLKPYRMSGLNSPASERLNTIFVFSDETISQVLSAFGTLLLQTFSDDELKKGKCWAVGQIHHGDRDNPRGSCIQHYWKEYSPDLNRQNPEFFHLCDYCNAGIRRIKETGDASGGINLIARGIERLLSESMSLSFPYSQHPYRQLKRDFQDQGGDVSSFENGMRTLLLEDSITQENWNKIWDSSLKPLLEKFFNKTIKSTFADWSAEVPFASDQKQTNVYYYTSSSDERSVPIHVGSIHSVKGQTHLATLVLDTFWYDMNLGCLKDWLANQRQGEGNEKARNQTRLKCHYVAMTRPTDLLCLAIHKDQFDDFNENSLTSAGWKIQRLDR